MSTELNKNPIWFIQRSLYLDWRIFLLERWTLIQKVEFILKKYFLLIKHRIKPFELGKDSVTLSGKEILYGTKFGLSDYQSMLTRLERLLNIANVKNPQIVFDIGANVGFFSQLILGKYSKTKLYSFEPAPHVYECLSKNLKDAKNVELFKIALSSKIELRKMKFDPSNTLISSLSKTGNIKVQTTTIDDFCQENKISKIDLLKIDVEGFEHEVLLGAQKTLENVNYLMIEITIENNDNYTISSLLSLLSSKKFDFQLLAYRNYADTAEGEITLMDTIFVNKKFI